MTRRRCMKLNPNMLTFFHIRGFFLVKKWFFTFNCCKNLGTSCFVSWQEYRTVFSEWLPMFSCAKISLASASFRLLIWNQSNTSTSRYSYLNNPYLLIWQLCHYVSTLSKVILVGKWPSHLKGIFQVFSHFLGVDATFSTMAGVLFLVLDHPTCLRLAMILSIPSARIPGWARGCLHSPHLVSLE